MKKVKQTSENEAKYSGRIREFQDHKDGKFLIVEEISAAELADVLIGKGLIKAEDLI